MGLATIRSCKIKSKFDPDTAQPPAPTLPLCFCRPLCSNRAPITTSLSCGYVQIQLLQAMTQPPYPINTRKGTTPPFKNKQIASQGSFRTWLLAAVTGSECRSGRCTKPVSLQMERPGLMEWPLTRVTLNEKAWLL